MIAIVDYGAGNLRSVAKALEHLGYPAQVTSQAAALAKARGVILPGVGAAADAMRALQALGLVEPLREVVREDKPFLGVCLGLQLLFTTSEEGHQKCLNLLPGVVRRLPPGPKVPHMGWNQVQLRRSHPLFEGIPEGSSFYFVHSYYPVPQDPSVVLGETEYGPTFCSAIARGNLFGTQFHPEKSGEVGLRLYDNFCRLAGEA